MSSRERDVVSDPVNPLSLHSPLAYSPNLAILLCSKERDFSLQTSLSTKLESTHSSFSETSRYHICNFTCWQFAKGFVMSWKHPHFLHVKHNIEQSRHSLYLTHVCRDLEPREFCLDNFWETWIPYRHYPKLRSSWLDLPASHTLKSQRPSLSARKKKILSQKFWPLAFFIKSMLKNRRKMQAKHFSPIWCYKYHWTQAWVSRLPKETLLITVTNRRIGEQDQVYKPKISGQ